MTPPTQQERKIPNRIALVVCPVCGRKAWSNLELKPRHFYRGERCNGTPETVFYLLDTKPQR